MLEKTQTGEEEAKRFEDYNRDDLLSYISDLEDDVQEAARAKDKKPGTEIMMVSIPPREGYEDESDPVLVRLDLLEWLPCFLCLGAGKLYSLSKDPSKAVKPCLICNGTGKLLRQRGTQ